MNKKGLSLPWETIIPAIVVIAIGIMLFLSSSNFLGKGTKEYENIREQVTDKSFLKLPVGDKSELLKEKERCDKLNPANCLGTKDQKSGCFWGEVDNQLGCYSCLAKKSYFGKFYGQCNGYTVLADRKIISESTNIKIICENNPCGFVSRFEKQNSQGSCLFSTTKTPRDTDLKGTFGTFCY